MTNKCKNCEHEIEQPSGIWEHTYSKGMYRLFYGNDGCTNPEPKED